MYGVTLIVDCNTSASTVTQPSYTTLFCEQTVDTATPQLHPPPPPPHPSSLHAQPHDVKKYHHSSFVEQWLPLLAFRGKKHNPLTATQVKKEDTGSVIPLGPILLLLKVAGCCRIPRRSKQQQNQTNKQQTSKQKPRSTTTRSQLPAVYQCAKSPHSAGVQTSAQDRRDVFTNLGRLLL